MNPNHSCHDLDSGRLMKFFRLSFSVTIMVLPCLVSITAFARHGTSSPVQSSTQQLQSLLAEFRKDDDGVRYSAAVAVSRFGREAEPILLAALNSEKGISRIYVARALWMVDPTNSLSQATLSAVALDKAEKPAVRRYGVYICPLAFRTFSE